MSCLWRCPSKCVSGVSCEKCFDVARGSTPCRSLSISRCMHSLRDIVRVSPFSMPKRKVGGYAISDSSDADSEPEQPPPKKKAFAPPLLTKSAFKRPNDSASSRPGLSLAYSAPHSPLLAKPLVQKYGSPIALAHSG
ncbi:hypothetical protein BDV93DRAFT_528640 [Ceratobasidium sp. AG-I]|nr:hypothetical protein BDV93DRAFT_528640 [Ceratobasidium sp. AG-I]